MRDGGRKAIPRKLRQQVWQRWAGQCFCCRAPLTGRGDWHCGHVVAHARGGPASLDNLRPVCPSCNWQMGVRHMYEWMNDRCWPVPMEE